MFFAFIPVILWALGSICTSRSARMIGAARANSWRLAVAAGALVQAVMAMTPVAVIPFAWLIDGDKPDWHGVVGGVLACGCAVALMLS